MDVAAQLVKERKVYQENIANCRAALRIIRDAIETLGPPGALPAEEYVEPPFTAEAEALVKGIMAIAAARG